MTEALKYDDFVYHTYDEYVEWEDRWELIDGIAYAMSPAPYPKHQRIVSRVWKEIDNTLKCQSKICEAYLSPVDWKVNDTTVVQPDVAIFCEETSNQYFSKTPPLVVEVLSKATALKDVTVKFELYQKEGVEFYLIIDPDTNRCDIFQLIDGSYQLLDKITTAKTYSFELYDGCKLKIDFGEVF